MYAIIALQGHQYIVLAGSKIVVDQIDLDIGATFQPKVLAIFDPSSSTAEFGTPELPSSVVCVVESHQRAKKIRVLKFKRKNRYERNFGHRSYQTTLFVKSI